MQALQTSVLGSTNPTQQGQKLAAIAHPKTYGILATTKTLKLITSTSVKSDSGCPA